MWACRSFLMSRPRTLHNSIRRHAVTEPPAVTLGAASRWLVSDTSYSDRRHNDAKDKAGVSSPRRNDGEPGTPAPADRRRTASRKQLYLVLNDAKHGNGIHKLDMDTDVAAGVLDSGALPRLPNPPVLRFDDKWMKPLAVLGSKRRPHPLTFDTRTAKLALVLDLPNGIRNNRTVLAVAAGDDRLFVIEDGTVYHGADYDNKFCMGGGLHCLKLQDDDTAARTWLPKARAQVVLLPLSPYGIKAHALHASGRAFFVSVQCYRVNDHRGRGTFSYNTEHSYWTRHGDWELPYVHRPSAL
nr:unnamed protein product [Digitaria exilis]